MNMKVADLAGKLNLKTCAGENGLSKVVSGCYICDLLSLAMSGIKENNIWITVQTNVNTVAVAVLTGASCIILPEGLTPDHDMAIKADREDIGVFSFPGTSYEAACLIKDLGI
jgi:hypothetical protein